MPDPNVKTLTAFWFLRFAVVLAFSRRPPGLSVDYDEPDVRPVIR